MTTAGVFQITKSSSSIPFSGPWTQQDVGIAKFDRHIDKYTHYRSLSTMWEQNWDFNCC